MMRKIRLLRKIGPKKRGKESGKKQEEVEENGEIDRNNFTVSIDF